MAKYSYEFKMQIVDEYLAGEGGYKYLGDKYGIPHHSYVRKWVAAYKASADEGLLRSRQKKEYSFEYKLHVVELYLTTEVSYQELAAQEKINNPSLITSWVVAFRKVGPQGLRPKKKGRNPTMSNENKHLSDEMTSIVEAPIDTNRLQALEDENLKLRIELAYLKELRRLRLQDEQLLKEQQESYIASEDHSN